MIQFFAEETRRNPFPFYEQIRNQCPLQEVPEAKLWMLFDYPGVKQALNDSATFASNLLESIGRPTPDWLIFFDPPRHTKLRSLISKAFTPKIMASLEPQIREVSRDLLAKHVPRGEMDLANDYSIPLPMMVIARLVGIPAGDWEKFRRWSDGILQLSYTISASDATNQALSEYTAVAAEIKAYLPALIEERRRSPQNDLLTQLASAEVDGERLSEREILGFFQLLIVAGQETTSNLINNAMLSFLENPEALACVRSNRELLPSAIEETLRFRSPIQWVFRGTTRDVTLHGKTIPAKSLVLLMLGSANRDPRQFPHPNQFVVTREPNAHVAFGHGHHFCLGAALSRLEARIALSDIFDQLGDPRLASDAPWEPRRALHVHGPARLPIRFKPAKN
jgi:cytochrome P450